jgi:hypothetical protein
MGSSARKLLVAVCLMGVTHGTHSAGVSIGPVSGARLAERCRVFQLEPDGKDGRFCSAYVRGFVDGSPYVLIRTTQHPDSRESFTERAARTRLGRLTPLRPQYCIDTSLSMRDLVAQILATADTLNADYEADASVLLYATLARFHKCSS